jgi:hypothetical protein
VNKQPNIDALGRQIAAREAEALAAERGAEASFERAQALRAVVEALDAEAAHVSDLEERLRLENESRLSMREADLAEGESRRLLSERDRALGQAKTAEVKSETIIHGRR